MNKKKKPTVIASTPPPTKVISPVTLKAEQLKAKGYDCENMDGVLIFFNMTMDEATELIHKYNYNASYGVRSKS